MYQNKMSNSNVTTAVEAAAMEAAVADGLITANGLYASDEKAKKSGLRRGKWTSEEEFYANRLIYEFKLGLLPLTDGTTLRTFLSKLLNCDPMRISKKFVGQNCIGKQVFRRRQQDLEKLSPEQVETSRRELADLERKFLERVAQTNRTKSTSGPSGKDGRMDYEDEHGNAILPPWMVPPATLSDGAHPSSGANSRAVYSSNSNANTSSYYDNSGGPTSSARYLQQSAQEFHNAFPTYQQQLRYASNGSAQMGTPNGANSNIMYDSGGSGRGDEPSLPRVTSMDVLNTIAQFNSPSGSIDNLASLGGSSSSSSTAAAALKQQQLQYQQQYGNGSGGNGNGNVGANLPASSDSVVVDNFPGLVMRGHSSTLTLGDSVGWPSFSNLNSFVGGGSMDDLLAAGLYNPNGASSDALGGSAGNDGSSGRNHQNKPSSLQIEEGAVGYPLEDSGSASMNNLQGAEESRARALSASATTGAGIKPELEVVPLFPGGRSGQPSNAQVRVKAPIVDVAGMSAMAHMYHPGGLPTSAPAQASSYSGNNYSNASQAVAAVTQSDSSARTIPPAAVRSDSARSNSSVPGFPKNGSVEDFWMLVSMGDLPQPEQDVLSQTVWSPLERANSGASTGSLPSIPAVSGSAGSVGGAYTGGALSGGNYTTITTVPGPAVSAAPLSAGSVGNGHGSANGSSVHKRPENSAEALDDVQSSKRTKF